MSIEQVKSFWNRRPCNIKHSPKEIGTEEYFNEVEARKYLVEPHIPIFADFDRWKDKSVLELGSGIGTDSINFARAGAHITCTDLSEESLSICKKRFQVYNLQATFYSVNAEELDTTVPVETYDIVYSFGVIHHSPEPEKIIAQIGQYMDSNSEARIMLYTKYSYKALEYFILNGWRFWFNWNKTIQYYAEAQKGCPVAYTYTRKSIRKLLKDYNIVSIEKTHIFPYKVKDYIEYRYKKKWLFRVLPYSILCWLESVLGWHYLIVFKKQ